MKEILSNAIFTISSWIPSLPILIGLMLVVGLGLITYNLLRTGKKGFGWTTLILLVGVLAFMLRVAVSVFREIAMGAAGSTGSDWDS